MFPHDPFGGMHSLMFTLVPLFILGVFICVFGTILFRVFKNVSQWTQNNAQSVCSVEATVVSKRLEVSGGEKHSSTDYFLTFEMDGGSRREFEVRGTQYGLSAEGDRGTLQYQGTRFLDFTRIAEMKSEPPPVAAPANLVCEYCHSVIPSGQIKCDCCGWTWRPTRVGESVV